MGKTEFKYEKIAGCIKQNILNGNYRVGEKVPSIRKLHQQFKCGIVTISKAFSHLEMMGLLEARPKSGYYVSPPSINNFEPLQHAKFQPPKTKVKNHHATKNIMAMSNDPNITSLGCSNISTEFFPHKCFSRIIKDFSSSDIRTMLNYSAIEGEYELRRHIAKRLIGVVENIRPEDIIITNGCIESVMLCLMCLVEKGETVAIDSPSNPILLQSLPDLGINVVEIPSSARKGFDVDAFESIIKNIEIKACILTPNFSSPQGSPMPDANKINLVEIAKRHNIPIIENDVYSELYYEFSRPAMIKSFDSEGIVLSCSSFSMTLAPGLRIGWVIPGKRFYDKILKLKSGFSLSTNALSQRMINAFLGNGGYDRHLRILRQHLRLQISNIAIALKNYLPEGIKFVLPKGGFILWVELPNNINSMDVFKKLLEKKILTIPGNICSNLRRYKHFLRISCGSPYNKKTEESIAALGKVIEGLLVKSN